MDGRGCHYGGDVGVGKFGEERETADEGGCVRDDSGAGAGGVGSECGGVESDSVGCKRECFDSRDCAVEVEDYSEAGQSHN